MKLLLRSVCFLLVAIPDSFESLFAQALGPQAIENLSGSPAGSKILQFIDLVATDKVLTSENNAPFSQNWSNDQKLRQVNDFLKEIRTKNGSFILYGANRVSFFEYELLVKPAKGEDWQKLKIQLQNNSPYAIESYELMKATAPAPSSSPLYIPKGNKPEAPRSLNLNKEALNELDKDLEEMLKKEEFSGVALVAEKWKPMFNKAYGLSNDKQKTKNDIDTKFNIGSINKAFTGISILQLAQQGRLSLSDKVTKYLRGLSYPDAEKVTIAQLLQHKSGYGMFWNNENFLKNLKTLKTIDEYMAFLKDAPVEFTPGTRQAYSNTGFILLGAVIEKITGKSYFDYIRENIFNPAAMNNSGFDTQVKGMATGYTKGFGQAIKYALSPNTDLQPRFGSSAGGGYSTASDMLTFFKTLYDCKFLNKEMTSLFLNSYNPSDGQLRNWTAGGGSAGLEVYGKYDYKNELLILVLSNFDPTSAQTAVKRAESRLYKEDKKQ